MNIAELRDLNPKRALFVVEYMKDHNAKQAAIRAGYSPKTAKLRGCQLIAEPNVRAAIDEAFARIATDAGITAQRVANELAKMGFSDFKSVAQWGPEGVRLVPSDEVDGAIVRKVSEHRTRRTRRRADDQNEVTEEIHTSLELHDKVKSLEIMAKWLGMFREPEDQPAGNAPPGVNININMMSDADKKWAEEWIGTARESDVPTADA